MTNRFTPLEQPTASSSAVGTASAELPLTGPAELQPRLLHFLRSLADGQPRAAAPLSVRPQTLAELYGSPDPRLVEALRRALDHVLVELGPRGLPQVALPNGVLDLPGTVFGVALAAHNCLAPVNDDPGDPGAVFTAALVESLPPARTAAEGLAYHVLLAPVADSSPHQPADRSDVVQQLLVRSPLTTLLHLELPTPPLWTPLAAETLFGWKDRDNSPHPWRDLPQWLDAVGNLLALPGLEAWLRRRWLSAPETRTVCRNLGLLLETLRRRGQSDDLLLEFYEAYDYFRAETVELYPRHFTRRWPLLDKIEGLLTVSCSDRDGQLASMLNRWGNEYFAMFLPLIDLVTRIRRNDRGQLARYTHLTREFLGELRRLLDLYTSPSEPTGLQTLGNVEFDDPPTGAPAEGKR